MDLNEGSMEDKSTQMIMTPYQSESTLPAKQILSVKVGLFTLVIRGMVLESNSKLYKDGSA